MHRILKEFQLTVDYWKSDRLQAGRENFRCSKECAAAIFNVVTSGLETLSSFRRLFRCYSNPSESETVVSDEEFFETIRKMADFYEVEASEISRILASERIRIGKM